MTKSLSLVALGLMTTVSFAQSVGAIAIVGVSNRDYPGGIGAIDQQWNSDNSPASASVNTSFTGMDANGDTQTMGFMGSTWAQSNYGQLHCTTSINVTNTYYNAANPWYYNGTTGEWNPNGTPDNLTSLGFATFTDTLQFGGVLESGYKARYLFHLSGTSTGNVTELSGVAADLGVNIAGHDEAFFAFGQGTYNEIFATQTYDINGITPQAISVQFSTQALVDTWEYPDGSNINATAAFQDTLTLSGIEVYDANGNLATGWTVTSGSGTTYPVPEPTSITLGLLALVPVLRRRSRRA